MNRLLLALIIVISAHTLIGMEVEETKPSPVTLAQTYYYFAHNLLIPEIAQPIFLLRSRLKGVNFKDLSNEIVQSCKNARSFVQYINTLINLCGSLLASELCVRFFPYKKISILDIRTGSNNEPSLYHAVERNYSEVAQILLKIAGDKTWEFLTMTTYSGNTALHYATNYSQIECIKILLNAAGDEAQTLISMQNNHRSTALHNAATTSNTKNMQLLLNVLGNQAQRLLTMQTDSGMTPLHWAVHEKIIGCIQLLLNAAGDQAQTLLTIKNNSGCTALDFATFTTIKILREYMPTNQ